ncbi:glycosyltransferase family 2 protein [Candidatus Uhrbacteria bacterium]|nr:glycosyltransferase family 2 protein [Candidatus Uhrbacteria bacterium]
MDLSIVIVSWNVCDRLRECLQSIAETTAGTALSWEVFVVDNASTDGSAAMFTAEFPWAHGMSNTENRGFAAACNQAIRRSQGAFVFLLNPDMRVLPGALDEMVRFLREPRNAHVGVAGGRLIDAQGAIVPHIRRFPTLWDQLAILCKVPHVLPRVLDRYLQRDFSYDREARVDSIRGSFFCIRRTCGAALGWLDETYCIWFEEVDFCRRARDAGWEIAYTPTVTCVDYVGQSFRQVALFSKQRMMSRSMQTYFAKHRPWWEWMVIAFLRPPMLAVAWVADRIRVGRRVVRVS